MEASAHYYQHQQQSQQQQSQQQQQQERHGWRRHHQQQEVDHRGTSFSFDLRGEEAAMADTVQLSAKSVPSYPIHAAGAGEGRGKGARTCRLVQVESVWVLDGRRAGMPELISGAALGVNPLLLDDAAQAPAGLCPRAGASGGCPRQKLMPGAAAGIPIPFWGNGARTPLPASSPYQL